MRPEDAPNDVPFTSRYSATLYDECRGIQDKFNNRHEQAYQETNAFKHMDTVFVSVLQEGIEMPVCACCNEVYDEGLQEHVAKRTASRACSAAGRGFGRKGCSICSYCCAIHS